jgi:hypothetical protein
LPLSGEQEGYDDFDARRAGVDPRDPWTTCARLAGEWNGHPAGSRVILGLTVEGYPFAIETV